MIPHQPLFHLHKVSSKCYSIQYSLADKVYRPLSHSISKLQSNLVYNLNCSHLNLLSCRRHILQAQQVRHPRTLCSIDRPLNTNLDFPYMRNSSTHHILSIPQRTKSHTHGNHHTESDLHHRTAPILGQEYRHHKPISRMNQSLHTNPQSSSKYCHPDLKRKHLKSQFKNMSVF